MLRGAPMNASPDQPRVLAVCGLLALITLAVYWPVTSAAFINYDDPGYVTENAKVRGGLTAGGGVWAFTKSHSSNWHPLTWLSLMLDAQLFGLRPGGFHFTNLLLHTANTLLLFHVLRRMTGAFWRCALVAALFAWHPLHVESVAWITERKDVLSTFFGLLALDAYVRWVQEPRRRHYALALLCLALSLMSKAMLVTLPCLLLLLDWWPLKRCVPQRGAGEARESDGPAVLGSFPPALLREKLSFFALSIAASLVTLLVQSKAGAMALGDRLPLADRLMNTVVSYVRYLSKTFWPEGLAVFYPHPGHWPVATVGFASVLLVTITVLVVRQRADRPFLLVGWLWYLGTLVPVIGLVQVGAQSMADRYTYVPLIGVFMMVAWALAAAVTSDFQRKVASVVAASVLSGCIVLTAQQVRLWHDGWTLFNHALAVTSNNAVAHKGIGSLLAERGDDATALKHFDAALAINPAYYPARYNRGVILARQGRTDEAMTNYVETLRTKPDYADAWYNLGNLLLRRGDVSNAVEHFQSAVRYDPLNAEAHNNLGAGLAALKRPAEAAAEYRAALKLKPDFRDAHFNLATILEDLGQIAEATAHYSEAVRLRPSDAGGHFYFGLNLARQRRMSEALTQFKEALRLRPYWPVALRTLAWLLATHPDAQVRNGTEAVALAERLCALQPMPAPVDLDVLATALAEAGEFPRAIETALRAVGLANAASQVELAAKLQSRLELYRAGKPFREAQ
jgi:tetratricopeptide (TPR) repeat protein